MYVCKFAVHIWEYCAKLWPIHSTQTNGNKSICESFLIFPAAIWTHKNIKIELNTTVSMQGFEKDFLYLQKRKSVSFINKKSIIL